MKLLTEPVTVLMGAIMVGLAMFGSAGEPNLVTSFKAGCLQDTGQGYSTISMGTFEHEGDTFDCREVHAQFWPESEDIDDEDDES
jgi:hypothetical protein